MEFKNNGVGRCVVLKESNTPYSLIYSITGKQFIIVSNLDLSTGNWLHGHYYNNDLNSALKDFNLKIKENEYER